MKPKSRQTWSLNHDCILFAEILENSIKFIKSFNFCDQSVDSIAVFPVITAFFNHLEI